MKLLHTADWHLGKKLHDFSRLEEQKQVLDEICEIADKQKVDAIIIAGDLYDTFNPPNEAVELFYKTLYRLADNGKRAVIAIAGNHDSAERIEAPDPLARQCGILFLGFPDTEVPKFSLPSGLKVLKTAAGFLELQLPNQKAPLRLLLTPYANESRLRKFMGTENTDEALRTILAENWQQNASEFCDEKGVNILVTHLFMMQKNGTKQDEPDDEKPILHLGGASAVFTQNIPSQIQYTALGHLHRYHNIKGHNAPVVYSGSLLEYSFSEAHQQKYVSIIAVQPNQKSEVKKVAIRSGKKLHRKRFENPEEAILWLSKNPNTFVELTLVSDDYLEASVKKQLQQTHSGIVNIIPEIKNQNQKSAAATQINLSQDIRVLFKEYFHAKKGQQPNTEILNLLEAILSE